MTQPLGIFAPSRPRAAPRPPRHLSAESGRLFRHVTTTFVMEDHDRAVLVAGLEALDRANAARAQIDSEGMTVAGFGQSRPHPLLAAEVQARGQFLAAWRQLGLDYAPVTGSERTAAARAARWAR